MAYVDNVATAAHPLFRGRVRMAAVITAVNVSSGEDTGDVARDSARKNLATNVLNDPEGYTERFVWAVLTNPVVAAAGINAPDSDLEFVLASVWNAVAGA